MFKCPEQAWKPLQDPAHVNFFTLALAMPLCSRQTRLCIICCWTYNAVSWLLFFFLLSSSSLHLHFLPPHHTSPCTPDKSCHTLEGSHQASSLLEGYCPGKRTISALSPLRDCTELPLANNTSSLFFFPVVPFPHVTIGSFKAVAIYKFSLYPERPAEGPKHSKCTVRGSNSFSYKYLLAKYYVPGTLQGLEKQGPPNPDMCLASR